MNKAREFDQSVVAELQALLGDRLSTSMGIREHHGKDESYFPMAAPDAVAFPHSTEEVRDIVNICRRHGVPLPAAALQFPLAHPAIASIIPGALSIAEVTQNLGYLRHPIPAALWQELQAAGLLAAAAPVPA